MKIKSNLRILQSLYPLTKFFAALVIIYSSALFSWKFTLFFLLPLCLILALLEGKLKTYSKKIIAPLILFAFFLILFQIFQSHDSEHALLDLKYFTVTPEALQAGLNKTRVIVASITSLFLFFETTSMEDLMIALQKAKLSHVATYIILSTLQLIPDMGKKSQIIMQAQQARGIETTGSLKNRMKAFFPSIGPLLISSISDLQEKSCTLEVRGFTADCNKTTLKNLHMRKGDYFALLLVLIYLITCTCKHFFF